MPSGPRYVPRGNVEIRRRGNLKGWETSEICTNDPNEVGQYLNKGKNSGEFARNTRVWVVAYGTIHIDSPELEGVGDGGGGRRKGKNAGKHFTIEGHRTIMRNTRLDYATSDPVLRRVAKQMEMFRDPVTGNLDIEYYCVRTREPM